ncbi:MULTISPECIES: PP2C family serine/threonine-protein phosphatase [unclassified Duganella]|uniref:PP2C family protein-serine/threonine phosphatase n=1 Tax=unclassified Duganella TaxID=2636909 RepID=UPI000888BC6B|nr:MULTISPECIES: PP2C family serine/threonine-protein phosphatase [unclassified Duganella]SDG03736.1 protein phosphatase [Duganella sp. OV458]SDJ01608.1 protein phosphatase [Duganella sp. OV510]
MQFSVYQESHIGGRKVNQDRMGYSFTRDALLLVLADGMGGHLRGEAAATVALQTIATLFQQQAAPYVKKPQRFLEEALHAAHRDIHLYRAEQQMPETPRTTIVACLIQHNTATWAHCGDSRLYWMRDGQILSRTRDHSHVESLIAKGMALPSERATHPDRNKLYNCLGADTPPRVEIAGGAGMLPGDVVLLCSDGLWSMLPDDELAQRLHAQTVVRAVPDILQAALKAAGDMSDNVTALAIMWQGSSVVDSMAPDTATVISTEALPEGLHSTTIRDTPPPAPPDNIDAFDDDEIEKAIAEIRGAIEKSSHILK